ncbi:FecR domain-containing protein [Skermanella mucosa]|uniref:FecR family protein n=1 Tax=Skermanella mucosa TaxID=1789672 RepID=UPI001E62E20E|nr:FecR domain-containing protein [Skermanella mucosa]UEM18551.1 FecR domain-containing protein [Skermanella mucosa]
MEQRDADRPGDAGNFRHPDPVTDAALSWFVALQDGTADPETLAAYREWRRSDPRHGAAFDLVAEVGAMPELRAATVAGARASGPRPRPPANMPHRLRWMSLAAASVFLLAGLPLLPAAMLRWNADYLTEAGDRRELSLPDGSTMVLDAASAVALDFGDGRRNVRLLRGEAFFDVVPDRARPFRVAAGFSTVEVTGTAFAVQSNGAEDEIFLEEGRITVGRLDDAGPALTLAPGERVTATAQGLSAAVRVRPDVALAWREGRYVFHEQPFGKVIDNLRRYYAGTILVLDHGIDGELVSGSYRLDDPVGALRSLAGIAGASVTVLPGGIVILA